MLRTVTSAIAQKTAEYCDTVWCRSAQARLIDPVIYDALGTVTGCLRFTQTDDLHILSGIQPIELRRKGGFYLHTQLWLS